MHRPQRRRRTGTALQEDNDRFWEKCAAGYDEFIWGTSALSTTYGAIRDYLCEHLDASMESLEVAAGRATLSCDLARCCKSLLATDLSEGMIKSAAEKDLPHNLELEVVDATNLPYADASFDAVIIANALCVIPSPEMALAEARRVLRPDGMLLAPTIIWDESMQPILQGIPTLFNYQVFASWDAESYLEFLVEGGFAIRDSSIVSPAHVPVCLVCCTRLGPHGNDIPATAAP